MHETHGFIPDMEKNKLILFYPLLSEPKVLNKTGIHSAHILIHILNQHLLSVRIIHRWNIKNILLRFLLTGF